MNRFDARKQGAAAKKTCTFGHFTEDRANDVKTEASRLRNSKSIVGASRLDVTRSIKTYLDVTKGI